MRSPPLLGLHHVSALTAAGTVSLPPSLEPDRAEIEAQLSPIGP